jgi:DNA-3-methyladenine glycosylase II
MTRAAAMRGKFVDAFGLRTGELRAMPELAAVAEIPAAAIGEAIGHRKKGEMIAAVVRGVAAVGEAFLKAAPYDVARDALLEVPYIGPFSAAAILLRGLGRMDELPWMFQFAHRTATLYGDDTDEAEIRARYGRWIGYWSFYLMVTDSASTSASARSPRSAASADRAAPRRSRGKSRGPSSSRPASRPA